MGKKKMSLIDQIAIILVSVGAFNWLLVGVLNFNIVTWLSGLVALPVLATILYVLIGLAGAKSLYYVIRSYM